MLAFGSSARLLCSVVMSAPALGSFARLLRWPSALGFHAQLLRCLGPELSSCTLLLRLRSAPVLGFFLERSVLTCVLDPRSACARLLRSAFTLASALGFCARFPLALGARALGCCARLLRAPVGRRRQLWKMTDCESSEIGRTAPERLCSLVAR